MHYFSKRFSKIVKRLGSPSPSPLNLRFGDLKLRDLAKLWFFKLITTKLNLKNYHFRMPSNYVTENVTKISDYASES